MITRATEINASALAKLAIQMWSDHTLSELKADFAEIISNENAVCFMKCVDGKPIGFAQCQIRYDYVEGTETSPVGYLEGIFIQEEFRHRGFAKELLQECEKWANDKKCSEFASDCELNNTYSLNFHLAMGFEEVNRIICFRKEI